MYSRTDRIKAIELYIKYNRSAATVINELGYPSRGMMRNWYKQYLLEQKTGIIHDQYLRAPKYTAEQQRVAIITFNFDDLVEKALAQKGIAYRPIWKEGQSRNVNTLPIFHVHGYLPSDGELDEPNLVFSEDTYHSQFINPYSWSNLVQLNTYSENVCIFIGLSLADPNLRRLLDISHRNNNQCKNYIVMCRCDRRSKIEHGRRAIIDQVRPE